jgi:hypothetical protein
VGNERLLFTVAAGGGAGAAVELFWNVPFFGNHSKLLPQPAQSRVNNKIDMACFKHPPPKAVEYLTPHSLPVNNTTPRKQNHCNKKGTKEIFAPFYWY